MAMETQENLVYLDDLTGLYNRRYLYWQLPKEMSAVQESQGKLWLFMLDIDDFKVINDTHGHLSGDELIQDIARIMKENTKATDKKIRYAGDEFTIILPNIERKDVLAIAERLVSKINNQRFKEKHSGREMHITVSVGIAGFPQDTTDPTELINLADKALYMSKQKGKNCVSVVSEITPELFWKKEILERFPCPVLAGRQDELTQLKNTLLEVSKGKTALFLITGELGIGKSRLLSEFENSLRTGGIINLSARCYDKLLTQPFYALGEALDPYLTGLNKINPSAVEGISETELACLSAYMPSFKDLIGEHSAEEGVSKEEDFLTPALKKFLLNISKSETICFTFDDLQYIDAQSLNLLTEFIKDNSGSPVFIVGTYSQKDLTIPELGDTPLAGVINTEEFKSGRQELVLSGLRGTDVGEIIAKIFLNVPITPDLPGIIYQKTSGNPLFVEELLKYLVEKEFVSFRDGKWHQKSISASDLPGSIEDVIKSRIDGLDEETKEMIAKAAVIGEDFQVDLLQKIDSEDKGYILDLVEAAKKIGLIYEKGTKGKDEFRFVTSEIRNILFNALGGERTKHLYSRIGQIKEQLHPDKLNSIAGELYFNFKKAEDQVRAEQYAKIVKEGKGAFYDRTIQYAQSLLEESVQEKMLLPLSKRVWATIPNLIRGIYMATVNYTLYPPGSKMISDLIEDIYKKIQEVFTESEILNIACVEQSVIVNSKKIGKELANFFLESFLSVMRNSGIESVSFMKGLSLEELVTFLDIICSNEPKEETVSELLQKQNVTNIQINEITYDVMRKKSKEKESLQEIMLIDYLLGKLPNSGDGKKIDLSEGLSTHAQEIAQALEKMGEEASKDSGKDKEKVKAAIMAKSIQKIGKQFLEKGEDWSKYKEGLAKTLLSMEPHLRANIFSSPQETEGKGKEEKGVDIIKEISFELPDDIVIDALTKLYLEKDTTIDIMRKMIKRFLPSPERKVKLKPVIKEKLMQLGASSEECELIFDENSWERLSLEEKVKKILQLPSQTINRLMPVIKLGGIVRELLSSGEEVKIEELENRFIQLWQEGVIKNEALGAYFREVMDIFLQNSPEKLAVQFTKKLLKINADKKEFAPVFFLILNNCLEKIMQLFLKLKRFDLIVQIQVNYEKDQKSTFVLSKILEPTTTKLVDELIKRIDINQDWTELTDTLMVVKEMAAKLLIDKALFEKGVPEGKYFEAYLRRRTIGKILDQIPKETLLKILTKEKFLNSPVYVVKNLIEVIGGMEKEDIVSVLNIPLDNPDAAIKRKVIFTLSKMKGEQSAGLLLSISRDTNQTVSREALNALRNRKDPFALAALKQVQGDLNG